MDTIIKIQILDEVYKFKADADAAEAREVGDFLMTEFRNLESSLGAHARSMNRVAKFLLLTMNIADAYLSLRQKDDQMITAFDDGSGRILKILP